MKISYSTDSAGYINNFAIEGEINGGKTVDVNNFKTELFYCYKDVEGKLEFDPTKE